MNWTYNQTTGSLYLDGELVGTGYSGHAAGRNNPAMQDVADVGPLPVGLYTIGKAYSHPRLGPVTMNLTPDPLNRMFGRSAFRMHGDNVAHDASCGCVVQGYVTRSRVSEEVDAGTNRLRVVSGLEEANGAIRSDVHSQLGQAA